MKYKCKKYITKTPHEICELFFCLPYPRFYPPQLPGRKICIIGDLSVKRVEDAIIFGRITDCETGQAVTGATVKIFYTDDEGELMDLCHTFSGCDGYYMMGVPKEFEGKTVTIMSTCNSCSDYLEPCECPG